MRTKTAVAELLPLDPTLDEELATLGDEDLFDLANLAPSTTGIDGVVFISTKVGPHGPRVKYFLKTGPSQPSFSVSIVEQPKVLASSLPPRVVNDVAPLVVSWVKLNRAALLGFWNNGATWMSDEVETFIKSLKRIAAD